jgi:hypothetical protein
LVPDAPPAPVNRIGLSNFARTSVTSAGGLGCPCDAALEYSLSVRAAELEVADCDAHGWIGVGLLAGSGGGANKSDDCKG